MPTEIPINKAVSDAGEINGPILHLGNGHKYYVRIIAPDDNSTGTDVTVDPDSDNDSGSSDDVCVTIGKYI